jgi:hypothetical protein
MASQAADAGNEAEEMGAEIDNLTHENERLSQ